MNWHCHGQDFLKLDFRQLTDQVVVGSSGSCLRIDRNFFSCIELLLSCVLGTRCLGSPQSQNLLNLNLNIQLQISWRLSLRSVHTSPEDCISYKKISKMSDISLQKPLFSSLMIKQVQSNLFILGHVKEIILQNQRKVIHQLQLPTDN